MSKFSRLEDISSRLFNLRVDMDGDISDRHLIMLLIDEVKKLVDEVQYEDT